MLIDLYKYILPNKIDYQKTLIYLEPIFNSCVWAHNSLGGLSILEIQKSKLFEKDEQNAWKYAFPFRFVCG